MSDNEILVSAIIPMYNAEKYIKKTLMSIINQTLKNVEIIVVDDASTDMSATIVYNIAQKNPNITLIKCKENYGSPSHPRNIGVKYSSGKFLTFVDADDTIESTMYEKMYANAIKENSDIVICGYKEVDEEGNILSIKEFIHNKLKYSDILEVNINPATWNKIYKKELFIENNIKFQHKIFCEDLGNGHEVFYYSKKTSLVNEPLYNYLVASQGASQQQITRKYIDDIFKALETNKLFLVQNNLFCTYLIYFFRRCIKQLNGINIRLIQSRNCEDLKLYFQTLLTKSQLFNFNELEYLLYNEKDYFIHYINIIKTYKVNFQTKYGSINIFCFLNKLENLNFCNIQIKLYKAYKTGIKSLFIYGHGASFRIIEKLLKKLNIKILGVIETENKNKKINYPYGNLEEFTLKINNKNILIISETFYDEIMHQISEFNKKYSFKLNILN